MEKRSWIGAEGLRGDPPSAENLSSSCRQEAWLRATSTGRSQNRDRKEQASKGSSPSTWGTAAQPLCLNASCCSQH